VKHFKFERRGARRMHQTPKRFEVEACRPWLDEELAQVEPEALAILGATAGKALFGASFRIGAARGRLLDSDLAPLVAATVHPSAILRTRDEEQRRAERQRFTEDLETLVNALG
jgi:DNA polymerase